MPTIFLLLGLLFATAEAAPKPSPHDVLGVQKSATQAEIKSAYRRLAKLYHPDRNFGDKVAEERFKEIQNAYDALEKSFPSTPPPRAPEPKPAEAKKPQSKAAEEKVGPRAKPYASSLHAAAARAYARQGEVPCGTQYSSLK